jgi:hypothetical protein
VQVQCEPIVRDAEVASGVRDAAVEPLVIDSREDVSTRSATLMTRVGRIEIWLSQLVASRRNLNDHARVIALSQRRSRFQVAKAIVHQRAWSVDNTSQDWER